jgi:hypothetical protein
MKISQLIAEAPKPQANDKIGLIVELNRVVTFTKPVKIPKLDRELLNTAVEEAVERFNASGKGNVHDVAFPYDSDFNIGTKTQNILGNYRIKDDLPGFVKNIKADVFRDYIMAVTTLDKVAAPAELYGKFVYNLIVHFWIMLGDLHRTDSSGGSDEERFAARMVLKGLGVNIVNPRR